MDPRNNSILRSPVNILKILVIAERMPSPLGGGSSRQFNLIRCLADRHSFTVVAHAFPEDLRYRDQITEIVDRLELIKLDTPQELPQKSQLYWWFNAWRHTLLEKRPRRGRIFQTNVIQKLIIELLDNDNYDLVQVHQAYMMVLLPKAPPPIVLDLHDFLSDYEQQLFKKSKKSTHRFQAWVEWQKMRQFEKSMIDRAQVCTIVSDDDKQKLLRSAPGSKTVLVTNGVDCSYFQPIEQNPKGVEANLVFCGSMNYPPNADGVIWFNNEIFPLIRAKAAMNGLVIRWIIVGWQPSPAVQALNQFPDIDVHGFVEDVRLSLAEAQVVIVPLRLGSGTRLKILEAWAMGKAVVSTSLGAKGLQARHGENILLADDPTEFSAAVLQLMTDPTLRNKLGRAARFTVENQYSWGTISQQMQKAYELAKSRPES
jgi:glycosyltransferase involved in cell wall biosynthesis